MSISEILHTALADTALGMGTVFAILILISIIIWLMGITVGEARPKKKQAGKAREGKAPADSAAAIDGASLGAAADAAGAGADAAGAGAQALPSVNKDGLTPEMIAAIATVAINQHLREQKQAVGADEYVVRNIRKSNWRRS